jgi:nitrite reductase (NO-forming)
VDREFYVMQGDFYTSGAPRREGAAGVRRQEGGRESPDYVVFNGRVGARRARTRSRPRRVRRIRLFVGNGGPNLSAAST